MSLHALVAPPQPLPLSPPWQQSTPGRPVSCGRLLVHLCTEPAEEKKTQFSYLLEKEAEV